MRPPCGLRASQGLRPPTDALRAGRELRSPDGTRAPTAWAAATHGLRPVDGLRRCRSLWAVGTAWAAAAHVLRPADGLRPRRGPWAVGTVWAVAMHGLWPAHGLRPRLLGCGRRGQSRAAASRCAVATPRPMRCAQRMGCAQLKVCERTRGLWPTHRLRPMARVRAAGETGERDGRDARTACARRSGSAMARRSDERKHTTATCERDHTTAHRRATMARTTLGSSRGRAAGARREPHVARCIALVRLYGAHHANDPGLPASPRDFDLVPAPQHRKWVLTPRPCGWRVYEDQCLIR